MPNRPPVELRDPDGTYVVVRPLDEVRGIVIQGTLCRPGELVLSSLPWRTAAREIGEGATRLSPRDLAAEEAEEPDRSGLEWSPPDGDAEVFEDAHRSVERRSRREDPREILMDLEGPEEGDPLEEKESLQVIAREAGRVRANRRGKKLRSA